MKVKINILKERSIVAIATWDGSMYEGTMTIQGKEDDEVEEQILGIIDARQDLADVDFASFGHRYRVKGWEGLEGNYGALRIAVEALGMTVNPAKNYRE